VSHLVERKEKDCLNCGTMIHGRYCHVCGQENLEPKESFWHLVSHFFSDITHFDGKFFTTLKDLLFKPGFLSKEYMKGRRASYLNPVRMYVFTSAIFFLVFFSLSGVNSTIKFTGEGLISQPARDSLAAEFAEELAEDPSDKELAILIRDLKDTSRVMGWADIVKTGKGFNMMSTIGGKYKTLREYDSIQRTKPPEKRDGLLKRLWNKKAIQLNEKYNRDPQNAAKTFVNALLHTLPYLLFVSLPFFALILKLLYIRRKKFYYADHGIFSVHHYILSFILLLLLFLWKEIYDISGWAVWNFLIAITIIAWPVYLFIAMKRFYGQGFIRTFLKFLLLNILGLIILVLLFIFFALFSVFQL
jgi:hypothetical protein